MTESAVVEDLLKKCPAWKLTVKEISQSMACDHQDFSGW